MLIDKVQNQDDSPVDYTATIAKIDILKTGSALSDDVIPTQVQEPIVAELDAQNTERAVDSVLSNPDLVAGSEA